MSKALKASKVLNRRATVKIGAIEGNVTCLKIWNLFAPSTVAASMGVGSTLSKPALMIKVVKGVHCHVSIITTDQKAFWGVTSQLIAPIPTNSN